MTTTWKAIYTDETFLDRDSNGKENLFGDIQQDKLREFAVFHNDRVISFFPDSGVFGINGLIYKTDLSEKQLDYRLIFFARRQKNMSAVPDSNTYFMGYQTIAEGSNKKRLIAISNNEIKMIKE